MNTVALKEWVVATRRELTAYMKEWMAQANPPKETSAFERMDGRPQLLFLNKTTHYFRKWTTASGVLKKNILT